MRVPVLVDRTAKVTWPLLPETPLAGAMISRPPGDGFSVTVCPATGSPHRSFKVTTTWEAAAPFAWSSVGEAVTVELAFATRPTLQIWTVVATVAELLAVFVSDISEPVTAVFAILASGTTMAMVMSDVVAPTPSALVRTHLTVLATTGFSQVQPAPGVTDVIVPGTTSVMRTFVAMAGPRLLTRSVYSRLPRPLAVVLPSLVIARSASVTTSLVTVTALLFGSGSCVSLLGVTTAVLKSVPAVVGAVITTVTNDVEVSRTRSWL